MEGTEAQNATTLILILVIHGNGTFSFAFNAFGNGLLSVHSPVFWSIAIMIASAAAELLR